MDHLVTVITFTYSSEMVIALGKLESEGIECFVQDEIIGSVYPLAVGGIKIQVKESNVPEAISILKEGGFL